MKRWWVSWWEPVNEDGDYRPMKWPLPPEIPKYWNSATASFGAGLCAVVDAPSEEEVKKLIEQYWKPAEWRFCNEVEPGWRPEPTRFPWDKAAGPG
jgi:hypothetical protein